MNWKDEIKTEQTGFFKEIKTSNMKNNKEILQELIESSEWGLNYHTEKLKELKNSTSDVDMSFEISHHGKEIKKELIRLEQFIK